MAQGARFCHWQSSSLSAQGMTNLPLKGQIFHREAENRLFRMLKENRLFRMLKDY
jgi:hypothetical protein